jgi:hypothetical protein
LLQQSEEKVWQVPVFFQERMAQESLVLAVLLVWVAVVVLCPEAAAESRALMAAALKVSQKSLGQGHP